MPTTNLSEVLKKANSSALNNINTCLPAQIESYDFTLQKATVKPLIQKQYKDGLIQSLPIIVDVPVVWPRTSAGSFSYPLERGDYVMLIFCQRSLDRFLNLGKDAPPGDFRKFDLTDAIAIPGLYPFTEESQIENNDDMLLVFKENKMRITGDGNFEFEISKDLLITIEENSTISIKGDAKLTVEGNLDADITGDTKLITGGDLNVETTGNANATIGGNLTSQVSGNASVNVSGSAELDAGGQVVLKSGTDVNITASNVNITGNLTVSGQTDLAGGGPGIARVGDSVDVNVIVTGGSSAGSYSGSGTITSGSSNSRSN